MTGPSRPHRQNQDSLTLLAARGIGWNYFDVLNNMLKQAWRPSHIANLFVVMLLF